MPTTIKKPAIPQIDAKILILRGGNANWFIKRLKVHPNTKVIWHCRLNSFTIWFPKNHNPIANGKTEIYGKNGKASAVVGSKEGTYYYSILVTDEKGEVHLVEGNSPPTMEIQ
jgi:hypothetical protein